LCIWQPPAVPDRRHSPPRTMRIPSTSGGWAHSGLDEANDFGCAGATLRFPVTSPFTGDFAYRLNVAAC
jgi:hypothetical protein